MVDIAWPNIADRPPADPAPDVARPCLALAIDDFGLEALAEAGLLPHPPLVVDLRCERDPDACRQDVERALATCLAAADLAEAYRIEPRIVLPVDLGGAALDVLPDWLAPVLQDAIAHQVSVSVTLVARLLTQGADACDPGRARHQIAGLLDRLLAPGLAGHGRARVILVTDRDGAGHRLDRAATQYKARHLLGLLLDPGDLGQQVDAAFAPLPTGYGEVRDPWSWTAAFAAYDLRRFVYPVAEAMAQWEQQTAAQLAPALDALPPATWEPRTPAYPHLASTDAPRFARLGPPHWQASLTAPLGQERQRVARAVDHWVDRARLWREDQVARRISRQHTLTVESARAAVDYTTAMERDIDVALADDALPGCWSIVDGMVAAASGRAAAAQLDRLAAVGSATPAIPPPDDAVAGGRVQMQAVIERRPNGRLLAIVAPLSACLIWLLIVAGGLTRFSALAVLWTVVRLFWRLPGPVWAWGAGAVIAALAVMTVLLVLNARAALEQAWFAWVHRPAVRWATTAAATIQRATTNDTVVAEQAVKHAVETQIGDIATRLVRLRDAFAARANRSTGSEPADVDRFARRLAPSEAAAAAPVDAVQIVHAFRREAGLPAWLSGSDPATADEVIDRLFALAVAQTGAAFSLATDASDLDTQLARHWHTERGAEIALLHPHYTGQPRWHLERRLIVPPALVGMALAHDSEPIVETARADQAVALDALVGLTAADLFGAAEPMTEATTS